MSEIEIKILEINREQVIEKLEALGASKIFDGELHAIYYDSPDNTLYKDGKTLRIRSEGKIAKLTIKHRIENAGAKEHIEQEVEISDFSVMRNILETLGFVPWLEMKKHRTSFEWDGSHFELDRYYNEFQFIPEFLEIESSDMERVYMHAELLGYSREQCKAWDVVQIASYYKSST